MLLNLDEDSCFFTAAAEAVTIAIRVIPVIPQFMLVQQKLNLLNKVSLLEQCVVS